MTSTFRIPPAPLTSPLGRVVERVATRIYGQVPDMVRVGWHHRRLMRSVLGFERRIDTWRALDPHLKSYAVMASAGVIGCSWCLDFGYYLAHDAGLDTAKVSQVPVWRTSEIFSPVERRVMEYAEAMTQTPPTVTDEMVATLREDLGNRALVELTMMVAVENQRSRFNAAVGLTSQGFSDVCELPLADSSAGQDAGR